MNQQRQSNTNLISVLPELQLLNLLHNEDAAPVMADFCHVKAKDRKH